MIPYIKTNLFMYELSLDTVPDDLKHHFTIKENQLI